jgi:hypothetical protein
MDHFMIKKQDMKAKLILGSLLALSVHGFSQTWGGPNNTTGVVYRTGNVGIGIINPTTLLDVSGGFTHMTHNCYNPNGPSYSPLNDPSGGLTIGWNRIGTEVGFYNVYANASRSFVFSQKMGTTTGGSGQGTVVDLMEIDGNGNVGIGAANPAIRLEVENGNSNTTTYLPLLKLRSTNWQCTQSSGIEFWNGVNHTSPTAKIVSKMESCTGSGESLVFETMSPGTNAVASEKMILGSGGQLITNCSASGTGDAFVINNVATSPNVVNFKIKNNGTVYAREIFVQATPFPDYVFSKDYKLPSLTEVKKYIQENNKLPNMPSAEKVKEDGASLGEIQRVSVEKIEELYLYVIQLKEENEKLKLSNEDLNERLKKLERK